MMHISKENKAKIKEAMKPKKVDNNVVRKLSFVFNNQISFLSNLIFKSIILFVPFIRKTS